MTKDRQVDPRTAPADARRIATADGAMLADPVSLGNWPAGAAFAAEAACASQVVDADGGAETPAVAPDVLSRWFEPDFWAQRGELTATAGGRGSSWFIAPAGQWVLRHYRRGGWIARISEDRYVWGGECRVRAFAEWRLLAALARRGLAVPKPIAARYRRSGMFYRCDLITRRIADAEPLSSALTRGAVAGETWRAVGAAVARMHAAGVAHADLNAHNILLDVRGGVSIIDFDRGGFRQPGGWASGNVARLHRSLLKIVRQLPPDRFSGAAWASLLAGYRSGATAPTIEHAET